MKHPQLFGVRFAPTETANEFTAVANAGADFEIVAVLRLENELWFGELWINGARVYRFDRGVSKLRSASDYLASKCGKLLWSAECLEKGDIDPLPIAVTAKGERLRAWCARCEATATKPPETVSLLVNRHGKVCSVAAFPLLAELKRDLFNKDPFIEPRTPDPDAPYTVEEWMVQDG